MRCGVQSGRRPGELMLDPRGFRERNTIDEKENDGGISGRPPSRRPYVLHHQPPSSAEGLSRVDDHETAWRDLSGDRRLMAGTLSSLTQPTSMGKPEDRFSETLAIRERFRDRYWEEC